MGVLLAATVGPWGCQPETSVPAGAAGLTVFSTPLSDTSSLRADWTRPVPELDSARIASVRLATDGALWVVARDGRVVRIDRVDDTTLFPAPDGLERPSISAAAPDPRGGIWVRDGSSGWILRLSPDGTWTRELQAGAGPLLWGRRAMATDDQGRLWVGIHPDAEAETPLDVPRPVYARLEARALVDTLYIPGAVTEVCARRDPHFRSGWLEDFRERYVPFPQWTLLASGALAAGCPAAYVVEIGNARSREASPASSATGDDHGPRLSLAMDASVSVPVGPDERNDFRITWTALMRTRGTPGAETWSWNDAVLPSTKPAYSSLAGDSEGNLWIWTAQPSATVPSNPTWSLAGLPDVLWVETGAGTFDVFDTEGSLVRHVRLPVELRYTPTPDTPEPDLRGDTVWAAFRGSEGETVVGRFSVAP